MTFLIFVARIERKPAFAKALALQSFALIAVLALGLAGCTGSTGTLPTVTGNEQGGKVPYAEGAIPAAMDAAKAHCGQVNKKAQITQMSPAAEGGGVVGFQCR